MRRRYPDTTRADQDMGRLQDDGELKLTTWRFVLPVDEILHQPFHLLSQAVGPGSVPQIPRVRLIGEDGVPIVLYKFP
jgi:hypothetical protein